MIGSLVRRSEAKPKRGGQGTDASDAPLAGRAVEPGVDLSDAGDGVATAHGGGFPQRAFDLGRPRGPVRRRRFEAGPARRLDVETVQTGFDLKLAREGRAPVRLGAQAVDFVAMLVGLKSMRIDAGPELRRRPGLR